MQNPSDFHLLEAKNPLAKHRTSEKEKMYDEHWIHVVQKTI
jgi:hypothetical protein